MPHAMEQAPAPEPFPPARASEAPVAGAEAGSEAHETAAPPAPWSKAEIEDIQRELKRLNLYSFSIDGKIGNGTRGGLTKAFGGESWKGMGADAVLDGLKGMKLPPAPGVPGAPAGWSATFVASMQKEMQRLGLYTKTVDGKWGPGTQGALVEAFGGDEWKELDPDSALARLKGAQATKGTKGEHSLRYGEMFKDNVLDLTLGVGFDEDGNHLAAIENFTSVLGAHGFSDNRGLAQKIYAQAGRALGPSAFGKFFVRKDALSFKPPAGPARSIDAVVRLISNPEGENGAQAAGAFKEGLAQSDVAYYSGHGRYGSGPDFDRNFGTFKLIGGDGEVESQFTDYEALGEEMKKEGAKHGRDAFSQFLWRVTNRRMEVNLSNDGNVFINAQNKHPGEFGAKLIYWALQQKEGGAKPVLGKDAEINWKKQQTEGRERNYRLLVFDGCRTQDYLTSVRSTPGGDTGATDVLNTRRTLNWGDEARTLAAFLDSVLGQQSAEKIVKDMDKQQSSSDGSGIGNAYQGSGLEDNPIFK